MDSLFYISVTEGLELSYRPSKASESPPSLFLAYAPSVNAEFGFFSGYVFSFLTFLNVSPRLEPFALRNLGLSLIFYF